MTNETTKSPPVETNTFVVRSPSEEGTFYVTYVGVDYVTVASIGQWFHQDEPRKVSVDLAARLEQLASWMLVTQRFEWRGDLPR